MKIGIAILIIVLILALMLGSAFVTRRNQMVIKREAVNAAWSQVDVVLQRRADLISNLVETVKGYAVQEQVVYGEIAKARSALLGATTPADKIAAKGFVVGSVVALAEKSNKFLFDLTLAELQSVDKTFGRDALGVFNLKTAMAQRNLTGAPGTKEVAKQLARWREQLSGKNNHQ